MLVGTEPVDVALDVALDVAAALGGFADCDLLSIRRSPLERAPSAALVVGGETHAAALRVGLGRIGHTTAKVTP